MCFVLQFIASFLDLGKAPVHFISVVLDEDLHLQFLFQEHSFGTLNAIYQCNYQERFPTGCSSVLVAA